MVEQGTATKAFIEFTESPGWKNASHQELVSDFISHSRESCYEIDEYTFEEKDGELYDPVRNRTVVGSAFNNDVEEDVNKQLEDWFLNNDQGIAIWISPRDPEKRYYNEKIIVHRIVYNWPSKKHPELKKYLVCAAIQFQKKFDSPEELRRFIFTEDDKDESVIEILNWIEKISKGKMSKPAKNKEEKRQQAEYFVNMYEQGVSGYQIAYEMDRARFLGEHSGSCAKTNETITNTNGSRHTFTNETKWEYHTGTCVNCGAKNVPVGPCSICMRCEKIL